MAKIPEEHRQSGTITRKGLLLKEAREAKGITIATVHEMTKIPLDVLHAIEDGYTVRMVSAYYFKGFIKMYAKFLDLDPSLVLDEAASVTEVVPTPVNPTAGEIRVTKFNNFIDRQSKKNLVFRFVMTGLIIVGLITAFLLFKKSRQHILSPVPIKKEQPKKKAAVNPPLVEKKAAVEKPKAKVKPAPKVSAPTEEEKPAPRIVPVVVEEPKSQPVQDSDKGQKITGRKVNLTIKARTTGWLQVKVDGNVVFQSTMHEGTTETWQAEKSIELSGKNINSLEFEVNGKVLGQLSKSDRGARRVVITSEGLSVRK